jgi:hypothetical protein
MEGHNDTLKHIGLKHICILKIINFKQLLSFVNAQNYINFERIHSKQMWKSTWLNDRMTKHL